LYVNCWGFKNDMLTYIIYDDILFQEIIYLLEGLVMNKVVLWLSLVLFASFTFASNVDEKILVYLSGPQTMIEALEKAFEAEHGDVLEFFHSGCGPLRQKVWAEMEAGKMRADVIWGSDPLIFYTLEESGMLQKYTPNAAKFLKDEYVLDNEYITLVNARYGVIIYNSDSITNDEIPTSFKQLTNKRWDYLIGLADVNFSSTALALVAGLWEIFGEKWDYFEELRANNVMLTRKNSMVPSKISAGELEVGIAPHDAVLRLLKKAKKEGFKSSLAMTWPSEGAISLVRPIAITNIPNRSERKTQLARDFVDFMLSKKAQQITINFSFVSTRNDMPLPKGLPKSFKIYSVDWKKLSENQIEIKNDFKKIMLK